MGKYDATGNCQTAVSRCLVNAVSRLRGSERLINIIDVGAQLLLMLSSNEFGGAGWPALYGGVPSANHR